MLVLIVFMHVLFLQCSLCSKRFVFICLAIVLFVPTIVVVVLCTGCQGLSTHHRNTLLVLAGS
eukprot:m.240098 g.240098  ORF g.240098 m.240098 type:complete len:63 (+) comp15299_c0_seq11:2683-2871(+)